MGSPIMSFPRVICNETSHHQQMGGGGNRSLTLKQSLRQITIEFILDGFERLSHCVSSTLESKYIFRFFSAVDSNEKIEV